MGERHVKSQKIHEKKFRTWKFYDDNTYKLDFLKVQLLPFAAFL